MLSLTRSPTNEFVWRGKVYKVDLAFDHVLLYLKMQEDKSLTPEEKMIQACKLFFDQDIKGLPSDPKFYEKAFEAISKVIISNPYGTQEKEKRGVSSAKQFDYWRDAGAIYASFFDQYGIDLLKERGKMHWDVFQALLNGLGPKTYFQRIIHIRQEDPSKIKDPQEKQSLLEAQNYYAVNGSKTEKELQEQAFNNQGLSALFNSLYEKAKKGGK